MSEKESKGNGTVMSYRVQPVSNSGRILHVTPTPEVLTSSSGFHKHLHSGAYTHTQIYPYAHDFKNKSKTYN